MTENIEKNQQSFWVAALGAETRFYDVAGYRTRCIQAGTGDPMILLHGTGGHAEAFIRNIAYLSQTHHVYALDMLGHGLTAKPAVNYTIPVLAEHVTAFMDTVGAERAVIVGGSLGGWVGGMIAAEQPDRVAAYVSVTGAGLEPTPDIEAVSTKVAKDFARVSGNAFEEPSREATRKRLEWLVYDPTNIPNELVEIRYRFYSDPAFAAIGPGLLRGLSVRSETDHLTRERLRRITCPALFLWTRHNPTMPWQVGQAASEVVPHGSFYLMEEAAHWPQFEKPEEFNSVVGQFLTKLPSRPAARR